MLKLPFIERTAIGIEITEEELRWVEINKLGNRITYKSSGVLPHNNSDASIISAIQRFKESVIAEAYLPGLTIPGALLEVNVEDLPFIEDEEEVDAWIVQKKTGLQESFQGLETNIQYQLIDIDEDSRSCIFQVLNSEVAARYVDLFARENCFFASIHAGVLEAGYTQIFNPHFTEGVSGFLHVATSSGFLTIFNQGLVQNVIELSSSDLQELLIQADSYLQSIEVTQEFPKNSMPLYFSSVAGAAKKGNAAVEREVHEATVLEGMKGFSELSSALTVAAGGAVKQLYPALDAVNFSSESGITSAVINHDKQEFIRVSVLLFVSLILIALLGFGYTKILDYRLIESNQIMDQVGGQIEEITHQRDDLFELRDRFLEAKSIIENNQSIAPVFELVETTIPEDVWIQEMNIQSVTSEQVLEIVLRGETDNERSITVFINSLNDNDFVNDVELLISQIKDQGRNTSPVNNRSLSGSIEFQLQVQVRPTP
ncbi:MAG: PilN domain-containing protein [Balneolales bacterium]|nr:PilN domain-containing protein [Balneolales bacterium]